MQTRLSHNSCYHFTDNTSQPVGEVCASALLACMHEVLLTMNKIEGTMRDSDQIAMHN